MSKMTLTLFIVIAKHSEIENFLRCSCTGKREALEGVKVMRGISNLLPL